MKKSRKNIDAMEEDEETLEVAETPFEESSDLCQRLMERYEKSSAAQHRHLCASASAMRTILQNEGLPLTPLAYFAATISAINDGSESLGCNATAALTSFLSMLLPLVPSESLTPAKATDAVSVLVGLLTRESEEAVSPATLRSVIKSLGILMRLCDLKDWSVFELPFETILAFSVDKRPKVRKCAQMCVEEVLKSFQSSKVVKKASKVILSFCQRYMPLAVELSATEAVAGSKSETVSTPEHLEVIHMLNVLKLSLPCLSNNASSTIMSELYKSLSCQFSPLTRHIFDVLEVFFESSRAEVSNIHVVENTMVSLVSYVSSGKNNPMDTVVFASKLLKSGLSNLHAVDRCVWIRSLPLVFGSISGLLSSELNVSSQATSILKELINHQMDRKNFMAMESNPSDNDFMGTAASDALGSICALFDGMVNNCNGVPNEHILAVLSDLFVKLGDVSYIFLRGVILKLAELARLANGNIDEAKHLLECIGSAVIAIGPEKILTLIPFSLEPEQLTCSNTWLIPILKKYVTGASLQYFMEHMMPLIESLQQACRKGKKSPNRKILQTCLHDLWDLLPSFCRYPTDTHDRYESLAQLFIVLLKKEKSMHENIALALQELVNQNRSIVGYTPVSEGARHSIANTVNEPSMESQTAPSHYTAKFATRNIKVMAAGSVDLLQTLTDVFFDSPPKKRKYLKVAIGCLASITENSELKKIFISLLEKFQLANDFDESAKLESHIHNSVDKGDTETKEQEEARRCMIIEFASTLVGGAKEELINIIFDYIKPALQATDGTGQYEAYYTLSKIFEEHTWFFSSRFDELMELLLGLPLPADIMSLRSRFACFHNLLVYVLKSNCEKKSTKGFLILNEIILSLKDTNEELRKAAYDILLEISFSLKNSSSGGPDSPHQKLFNMIMGYLSGASPSITSGAVAALSLLVYKENDYFFSVTDLVPSVLALLQNKSKEVIKAVLGFVKVLVSSLQASDLQKLLPDIVNGILPWSSVSRNHFRAKVTVILEIIIRKCGSSSIEQVIPEKYKRYIKTIKEHRHGGSTTEMSDVVPKSEFSSWGHKKTRRDSSGPGEGTDSWKSKTDLEEKGGEKRKFNTPNKNDGSPFSQNNKRFLSGKTREHLSRSSKNENQNSNFNKRPNGESEGKTGWRNASKSSQRPAPASKFHKHKKVGRHQQRK